MLTVALLLCVFFLSYSNGANDNFKGVATIYGSGTASYRSSLWYATTCTLAGSVLSVLLARELAVNFSGKGLIPVNLTDEMFLISAAAGAGGAVMLATLLGLPVSTTHSIVGALAGAGFVASSGSINYPKLAGIFFIPLFASPLIALAISAALYLFSHRLRVAFKITKEFCLCAGKEKGEEIVPLAKALNPAYESALGSVLVPTISAGDYSKCIQRYDGRFLGIKIQRVVDAAHFLSAGVVSFARGLNDTPKIAGLLLVSSALDISVTSTLLALFIAAGGLFNARKVADTMSLRITELTRGQGLVANVVTSALVTCASGFGVPVSTTHVSCGTIFGMGIVRGKADKKVIAEIVFSWIITLPVAAMLASAIYLAGNSI